MSPARPRDRGGPPSPPSLVPHVTDLAVGGCRPLRPTPDWLLDFAGV
jgi:hypothetical protein